LALLVAAALLSLERICYIWVWRFPGSFGRLCRGPLKGVLGERVDALRRLFYGFKLIQLLVFAGWCYVYGDGSLWPAGGTLAATSAGLLLIATGQMLNIGVFYRLGNNGVFYGNRFGFELPWQSAFPFSLLAHPQYVGAVLSIWGFFIAARFPHPDWYLLPSLETVYYLLGARFEG
jgi:methylene-fatty-acyl-phospholipid synthase